MQFNEYIMDTTTEDDHTIHVVCVCVCVRTYDFRLVNAGSHLNITALFPCHFPSSHSIHNKLHRLDSWVTEAFIKIRSTRMKISSVENLDSMGIIQQIYNTQT